MATGSGSRKKSVPSKRSEWTVLATLIQELDDAARADEMKGGGDPADFQTIELNYALAQVKVNAQLEKMERDCDCPQ